MPGCIMPGCIMPGCIMPGCNIGCIIALISGLAACCCCCCAAREVIMALMRALSGLLPARRRSAADP